MPFQLHKYKLKNFPLKLLLEYIKILNKLLLNTLENFAFEQIVDFLNKNYISILLVVDVIIIIINIRFFYYIIWLDDDDD